MVSIHKLQRVHDSMTNSLTQRVDKTIHQRREQLRQSLEQCRLKTLSLFAGMEHDTFCTQAHPDFSPVGWHLGHIAYTEALWLLEHSAKMSRQFPEFGRLFIADALPKTERRNLPTQAEIRCYLDAVRAKVLDYLEIADLDTQERLWWWLVQHESQHSETVAFVLQLQKTRNQHPESQKIYQTPPAHSATMIEIPAGYFELGNDAIDAMDNERPAHRVYLDTYAIDRYPVTCSEYQQFIDAEGYQNSRWWSKAGWEWLQSEQVTQPLYWQLGANNHPVCGVSWYEAEAYAQFVDKRLPTEAEWEKAASWDAVNRCRRVYPWGNSSLDVHRCNCDFTISQTTPVDAYSAGQSAYGCYDMLGNVWEWTASIFQGYPGFASFPYIGYSQTYFDEQHRVLRGGSWATLPWALRCSFRNWYHPHMRQMFAGFRCAK